MTSKYTSSFDITIPFSDTNAQIGLGAGVEETLVIPGTAIDKYSARFGYTLSSHVFVRLNDTPLSPPIGTGDTQTYCELNPGFDGSQRYVQGGDELHFVTPDVAGAYVSVSLRKLPG